MRKIVCGVSLFLISLAAFAQKNPNYFAKEINFKEAVVYQSSENQFFAGDLNNTAEASSAAIANFCQTITLHSGWNIISVPVYPEPANIQDVFQTLIDDGSLVKIQDESGNTLEDWGVFGNWKNKIGNIVPTEGYKIRVNANKTLQVCGQPVSYPFEIPLAKGWNIIGFPGITELNAMDVLQPLITSNTLAEVQDENGNSIHYQNGWQNNIGNFVPGKGYRIKMTASDILYINDNSEPDYELHVRSGLPNFLKKVKNNESVNVVYFGGSITNAEGWRLQTAAWMRNYFNNTNINDINSSISGTSSAFGAYRTGRDILSHNPDLVLIEFAVNDIGRDSVEILKSMEGIVRQVKNDDSNTEICFVYTVQENTVNYVLPDNLHETVRAMEKVADYYRIPSIHFGPEVKKRLDNGELIFKGSSTYINGVPVFSSDGTHPYAETGHVIYTEVFKRAMKKLEIASPSSKIYPSPLRSDNFVNAKMIELSNVDMAANWEALSSGNFSNYSDFTAEELKGAMFTNTEGDYIRFRFKGTYFGVTDVVGPSSGYLNVSIDESTSYIKNRFDPYCSYYRINFFLYGPINNQEHTVTMSLVHQNVDKRSILNNKSAYDNNPSLYEKQEFYPILILINGELVPQ